MNDIKKPIYASKSVYESHSQISNPGPKTVLTGMLRTAELCGITPSILIEYMQLAVSG